MDVCERFLRYVSFDTQSDALSDTVPSTARQRELADFLAEDLRAAGAEDARVDDQGYVYATVPANCDRELPVIGLIAHMDTASDCSGKDVKPSVVAYEDGDIVLNAEKNIVLRAADFPSLALHRGQRLVVTDGTTLLGADDKAGAAEIVTAAERLLASDAPHGTVRIAVTPDEEIGRGADHFDLEGFGAAWAYTVDGGRLGELEYENFNAASGVVTVRGVSVHPGDAKGLMKNACLIAMEYNGLLPAREIPARTEGYEGFFHLCSMQGTVEEAKLGYIIRDHDRTKFEARKALFADLAELLNGKYGPGTVEAEVKDSYYNMKEQILPHMAIVDAACAALEKNGVVPRIKPIRGGTDGARLSFLGLPCPNLCTGGENFHGRFEYIPVEDMEKMVDVLVTLLAAPGE